MGRYDLDEYDKYEDEGEDQEEDIGEDEEEEEEEVHPPSREELEYLHLRQKLKESIRKKMKKDSSSKLSTSREKTNKMPYDNFGSFFGPSQPVIAQRVIQESKSLLENPHLAARFSKAKNVQNKGGASTPVISKPRSCEQPREVINLAKPKAKIQMLRDTRDYSFLLSEDANLPPPRSMPPPSHNPPRSMPPPAHNPPKTIPPPTKNPSRSMPPPSKNPSRSMPPPSKNPSRSMPPPSKNPSRSMPPPRPEVHSSHRKPSITPRKVINGSEERKSLPKVSQARLLNQKPSHAAKLNFTSLEPSRQISRNDGSGPARPSAPKALPVARKENMFSASVAKGPMTSVHKSPHSKPSPSIQKKPVVQKRDDREPSKGNVIAKKPMLSSKPQIKQQPAKAPPSVQQKERLKKRPSRSYSDDEDDGDRAISMIRSMFRYNPSRYRGSNDDDDSDMEAGFDDIMREEKRSARIAAKEDEEELRKIEEEERREQMRKAAKKRKLNQQ